MPDWRGRAVLQVPIPALEPFVAGRTAHHDPGFLGMSRVAGETFVHAHVTVLAWFDEPPQDRVVAALAAAMTPFEARFGSIATFPNGIIHAVPDEPAPFRAMTAAAQRAFPDVQPYDARFDVAPHVTLEASAPGMDESWVAGELGAVLPTRQLVAHLDLVWYEQGSTGLLGRWALG